MGKCFCRKKLLVEDRSSGTKEVRTCGSISRCSTDLRLCVRERARETTSFLSNQTSWDFPNADRDLYITVSVLEEVGIHRKKKRRRNVWHYFRGIPDPPVGSAEREWNRQMYFNKARDPEVAFYSEWNGIACLSHPSHMPLMMTDTSKGRGLLLRGIFKR